jgi:hypothetical protein
VRPLLERWPESTPGIRAVIPGRIGRVRDARGPVEVRVTVPTQNRWKAIALSAGARQELFAGATPGKEALEQAFENALERG